MKTSTRGSTTAKKHGSVIDLQVEIFVFAELLKAQVVGLIRVVKMFVVTKWTRAQYPVEMP